MIKAEYKDEHKDYGFSDIIIFNDDDIIKVYTGYPSNWAKEITRIINEIIELKKNELS